MRIVAEKSAIAPALSFVCAYAAKDNRIPILSSVRLVAEGAAVSASATDADRAARSHFAAAVETPGGICLPASLLLSAIANSTGSEVSIDADDRKAAVRCGKQRFTLPVLPASDFPPLPMLDGDEGVAVELDGEILSRVSKQVSFAAEDPKGRHYLAGTSWRTSGGKLEFCATDGKRLSMFKTDTNVDLDIIVPVFDIPAWSGPVSVVATERSIRFAQGDRAVASKLVEGTYPDVRRIIPAGGSARLFDRCDLIAAIKRVSLISDAKTHSVLIVGRDGVAFLSGEAADKDAMDEVAYDGDDFQIALLNAVVSSVLTSFDCEMVELLYTDHASPVVIRDPRDENRIGFAMPYADRRIAEYLSPSLQAAE